MPVRAALRGRRFLPQVEATSDLLIRARRAYDQVAGDPRRYGPVAADLVVQARRARQTQALVLALRAHAWAERSRLANLSAKRLLDEASRIARRELASEDLALVLLSRAAVNQELGRLSAAQRDLDAASALLGARASAELALQQAALHQNIGRLGEAERIYRRVLAEPATPPRVKAIMANNLAMIDCQRGRHAEALRGLEQALPTAAGVGPAVVALLAESRAWVTVQSGRLPEGLRLFDTAEQAYRAAELPLGEHYTEYVDALLDLRLLPEAQAAARRAVAEFTTADVPLMEAEARLRAAQLALQVGDLEAAVSTATHAAASFRRQGRPAWTARSRLVLAEARLQHGGVTPTDLREVRRAARRLEVLGIRTSAVQAHVLAGRAAAALGRRPEALHAWQRAEDLARGAPVLVRLRGRLAAALAARARHRDADVLAACRRGLNDLTRHRMALPSMELRALASGHGVELGRMGLQVAARQGSPTRVLEWMERTRAAALSVVEPPAGDAVREDLVALHTVQAELADLVGRTDHGRHEHGRDDTALLARQRILESRIRRAAWQRPGPGVGTAGAASVSRLRHALDRRVLVEYAVLDEELLAVTIDRRGGRIVRLGPVAAPRRVADGVGFALGRIIRSRSPAVTAAARASAQAGLEDLRRMLVSPLALAGEAELVVVPASVLHRVPWASLHPGPVSLAPSATHWARTRERARPTGQVALVAGPGLTGAHREIDALRERYPQARVLVPPGSTIDAVLGALDGADLAHLACHGRLRSDNPMFSGLALSDGMLTVQELDTHGVAPHRVILASCESAADVGYPGEELLGFVSALLARGTAGILASIVVVSDLDAVPVMTAVHEHLGRGRTLAESLHAARRDIDLDEPAGFVNWCAFTAYGGA